MKFIAAVVSCRKAIFACTSVLARRKRLISSKSNGPPPGKLNDFPISMRTRFSPLKRAPASSSQKKAAHKTCSIKVQGNPHPAFREEQIEGPAWLAGLRPVASQWPPMWQAKRRFPRVQRASSSGLDDPKLLLKSVHLLLCIHIGQERAHMIRQLKSQSMC